MPLPLDLAQRRYIQQASWTRPLREYLLKQAGMANAQRVLEIGCGAGAILSELAAPDVYGVDIDREALLLAAQAAPTAKLSAGDAHWLPYPTHSFDIVCFHFVLLWLANPVAALREVARVTRPGGAILAFAEPDYTQRGGLPAALAEIGQRQSEALRRQGANPASGGQLAALFQSAGLKVVESGPLDTSPAAFDELELEVLRSDLGSHVDEPEWQVVKQQLSRPGVEFSVPTYFAWANRV